MSLARRKRVVEAIRSIKRFHALGRHLLSTRVRVTAADGDDAKAEAGGEPTRLEMEYKARQFADAIDGYTRAQLAELCRLIKTVQPGQEDALGIVGRTHVIRLLAVKWPRRARFQRLAVEHGWSLRRLNREIAVDQGTRREGGRWRRLPTDRGGLLTVLETECERWRRLELAVNRTGDRGQKSVSPAGLTVDLLQRFEAASTIVRRFQKAVTEALTDLHPKRALRTAFRELETGPTGRGNVRNQTRKKRPK